MLKLHAAVGAAMACVAVAAPAMASADCKLIQIAQFKLDPHSASPLVDGTVNGHPVKVLLDTGSDFSEITYYETQKLGLPTSEMTGARAYGVGGSTQMYSAEINRLEVGDLARNNIVLLVAGDRHDASEVGVVIGDDVLSKADIEFDLAHNAIRLFEPKGCTSQQLVYWGAAYSQADLLPWERDAPRIQTQVLLNGKQTLAELDSGADTTFVDASVADADGASRSATDAPTGPIHGAGPTPEESWVGHFDSFGLGDEKISHVAIQVVNIMRGMSYTTTGDLTPRRVSSTQMYVGDDFLRAHRVFVDNQDHLILFSYQGGPVFSTAQSAPSVK